MIFSLVLPALAALAVGVPVAGGQRRLHPRFGAIALAMAAGALTLAVAAALASVALGFVSTVPWIDEHLGWCRSFSGGHDAVPVWLGLPALGLLAAMVVGALRAYRGARRELWTRGGQAHEILVVDQDRPQAYAVGGPSGHIVVSTGMMRLLGPAEHEVLLAHERSHLRHGHYRYLILARVVTAAMPVLGFVTRRLRLAIERWADEDAVRAVGGDRGLVARTIIRAALAKTDYEGRAVLALGSLGVRARVDALLMPPPSHASGPLVVLVSAAGALALVLVGSALQVHHLLSFASHVCGL